MNMLRMSDIIRKEFAQGDDKRDAGLMIPKEIQRFDNICYGDDKEHQVLDVYMPKNADVTLPVIISVHGGGWVYGDKDRYQFYCMDLAKRGFVVVNFTYRLAPEYKFPASLEDTNLVMEWVLKHKMEYKMDIERIFAVGDSAGAHILCLYMDICLNKPYATHYDFKTPKELKIQGIALNCGQYYMIREEMDEMTSELMKEYLPQRGSEEELKLISAGEFVTTQFPPTYIVTAENDFLRKQSYLLYEKLKKENVVCEFYDYKSKTEEKLGHVFHLDIKSEYARECNDAECNFFVNIGQK